MEERRCICPLLRDHVRHRQADFSAHGRSRQLLFSGAQPRQSRAGLSVAAQPARVCLCAALPACADRYQYADVSAFYLKIPASPYHQGINLSSPVPFCRLYIPV